MHGFLENNFYYAIDITGFKQIEKSFHYCPNYLLEITSIVFPDNCPLHHCTKGTVNMKFLLIRPVSFSKFNFSLGFSKDNFPYFLFLSINLAMFLRELIFAQDACLPFFFQTLPLLDLLLRMLMLISFGVPKKMWTSHHQSLRYHLWEELIQSYLSWYVQRAAHPT